MTQPSKSTTKRALRMLGARELIGSQNDDHELDELLARADAVLAENVDAMVPDERARFYRGLSEPQRRAVDVSLEAHRGRS